MKKFKKLNAVITATLMAAALSVPMASSLSVSAASGDNSITVIAGNDKMTHTAVAAYQVFAGTYNDTDANLTITGWGDGIDVAAFITAIKADSTIIGASFKDVDITNDAAGAQAVADIVGKWTDNSDEAKAFAKLAVANAATKSGTYSEGVISGIADGYYVMADESAATATDPTGSAFTLGLLQVVGGENVEVTTKIDYPTVVKKVQEDDKTDDGGYGAGFNDVADWDANTDVPFKIIATMPSNIDEYDHYYMNFTDTLDDTFGNPENIVVTAGTKTLVKDTDYKIETTGNDMNIVIMDLKGVDGLTVDDKTTVTVTYTAKLNVSGANLAIIGHDGQENKVKLEYSNNPNKTGDGSSKPDDTGETPEDKVIVFTYELDITKIDGATKAAIENAEFKLGNDKDQWATVNEAGYFTGWVDDEASATVLKSDANGIFKVIGLDDGKYKLKELNWSEEYNIPETAFEAVIDANTAFTQDDYANAAAALIELTGSVNGKNDTGANAGDGIVAGTIENNKGTTLPSTGGIGTTLFYVGGGCVVALAGVALITKKRMNNRED